MIRMVAEIDPELLERISPKLLDRQELVEVVAAEMGSPWLARTSKTPFST